MKKYWVSDTEMETREMVKKVPGPREIPFIGNLLELGSKPHEFFKTCVEKYGPVVRVQLDKDRDTYLLSRPQDIQYVLKIHNDYLQKDIIAIES
jgi:cytochrome P450